MKVIIRSLSYAYLPCPLGKLLVTSEDELLTGIYFPCHQTRITPSPYWELDPTRFDDLRVQLDAYFAGERREFDLPFRISGTPFEMRVWKSLLTIPYGTTVSYGEIARRIGQPKASRAVGMANGRNPIPILVPCHRVIGSNGSLVGYGGGLETKKYLLEIEGVDCGESGMVRTRFGASRRAGTRRTSLAHTPL
jgi:methylated-DNA-[protein]-cysteine S-methyltransferase